ncbi:MAG: GAF domain-containing protein, partial [Planctomycetota bacterium]
ERLASAARRLDVALPIALRAGVAAGWLGIGDAERARAEIERWPQAERAGAEAELLRAEIALVLGEHAESARCFEQAARFDESHGPRARLGRARALASAGRWEDCEALAREALPGLDEREGAEARALAASAAFRRGDSEAARAEFEELIRAAQRVGNPVREAALRQDLGTLERRAGSLERALEHYEESERLYARAGVLAGSARARTQLAGLLRERGELLRADELLQRAIPLRERLGDKSGAEIARGTLGLCLAERGHVRAALEELARAELALRGAAGQLHGPLLRARISKLEARIGASEHDWRAELERTGDPRALLSLAREAALRGDPAKQRALAERAADLARRLGLDATVAEAEFVRDPDRASEGVLAARPPGSNVSVLVHQDAALWRAITRRDAADPAAELAELEALCRELLACGRDDRAARACAAIAARAESSRERARWAEEGRACLARCSIGLSITESAALAASLLGLPDPRPADLVTLEDSGLDEDDDMQLLQILELNHRLVREDSLPELLGAIVESAISVTGAERGFLVLEEEGRLVFDTARDSRRGGIEEPELAVSRSVIERALAAERSLRLSNAAEDPLLGKSPSVVALELRSILCAPFTVGPQLRGALYVDHRLRTGAFDARAERLLGLLCDQAAIAIAQVRRVEEIRRLNERLGERVAAQASDLATARAQLARVGLPAPAGGIVGSSPAIQRVRALLERAAAAPLPVLVTGPSGSGKELAARALHELSPRARGPWVAENCAALPASLIEAELFGHRRGSFTGAEEDRAGLFERASGGTLLLDEIGELPLELQAKLLRVLETGRVRRLGDTQERECDFRLIAATNRDLQREVREGRFREDLYYRLNALHIALPTLDERLSDVPELVEHFLRFEEVRSGVRRRASREVLAQLSRRRWPGNVRELQNEVLRLCALCRGDLDDPDLVREAQSLSLESFAGAAEPGPRTMEEIERAAILAALTRARGDRRAAAQELGISRAKVYQRIKDWRELGMLPASVEAL